jgi:hypothetical protein
MREHAKNELADAALDSLGFNDTKWRRVPGSRDIIMENPENGFWRLMLCRYLDTPSTPESREEGLQGLKTFLMSNRSTRFPPNDIITSDATNPPDQDPCPLDMYLLDADIEEIMKMFLDEESFNPHFYEEFPEFARLCWSGPHNSDFAVSLGIPRG